MPRTRPTAICWMLTCACLLLAPTAAHAQVRTKDVRLYLDMGLVTWTSERTRGELRNSGADYFHAENQLGAGFASGGVAGVGLAYVLSPHLMPGLYFALQHVKGTVRDERGGIEAKNEGWARFFELRPYLEVPFNPSSRFVLYGMGGLSLTRKVNSADRSRFAVGPALGLGGHGFISPRASLDLGLTFRAAFATIDDDAEDALELLVDDPKQRDLALLFTIGASFWL
jgi:hypothetical protein